MRKTLHPVEQWVMQLQQQHTDLVLGTLTEPQRELAQELQQQLRARGVTREEVHTLQQRHRRQQKT